MKLKNILTITVLLFSICHAIDLSDYGDFSSRSVILKNLEGTQTPANQEQKDLLASKKLAPTQECLFRQIKKGDLENVKALLDAKVNPNQGYFSEYAIYLAAKENRFEILKLLHENGAKLDRGFNSELYEAIKNKNKDMAQFLLDNGAKVNYLDSVTNNTILYLSLKNKMYDISSQLIKKGARADLRSVKYIKKNGLEYLINN